jgi:hypothetical protein
MQYIIKLFELNRFEFKVSPENNVSENAIADYQHVTESNHVIEVDLNIEPYSSETDYYFVLKFGACLLQELIRQSGMFVSSCYNLFTAL